MPLAPIRCFDGNAQPHEPFWKFRDAAITESGETEVELYGPISEFSWFGDEITPKQFKDDLYRIGAGGPVTVRLNSYGGDLIAASVIRATMLDYPGKVTVKIDGVAASAAVMVALGGDVIKIQASAYMMIHNPAVGLLGYYDVDQLKSFIDELKVLKSGIVEAYMQRTGLDAEKLAKMMDGETWMTASEAVALGFADEVISAPGSRASSVATYVNEIKTNYVNVPRALLNLAEQPATEPEPPARKAAKRLAAQARIFIKE
jgi:ATP-dependent protease ClpP protease subunit